MKKLLSLVTALCLLCGLLVLPAFAAQQSDDYVLYDDTRGTICYDTGTHQFDVSYSGATDGNWYVLWVLRRANTGSAWDWTTVPTPSLSGEGQILYLDQVTASGGTAQFNNFIPYVKADSIVFISGTGLDSPVILGYLKAQGVDLTGSVNYPKTASSTGTAAVKLYSGAQELLAETTTATDGSYSFSSVPEGTGYSLEVSKSGFLTYTYSGITVTDETAALPTVDIRTFGGDINGSGAVYEDDFQTFINNFNKTSGFTPAADLNSSGAVYEDDFSILLAGFNKTAAGAAN